MTVGGVIVEHFHRAKVSTLYLDLDYSCSAVQTFITSLGVFQNMSENVEEILHQDTLSTIVPGGLYLV